MAADLTGDRLLKNREAAAFLGVSPQTLDVWRSTKRVPIPYTKIGSAVRYRLSELQRYADSRTVTPGQPS